MKVYGNGEGYYDPTAGKAIMNTERGRKMQVSIMRGDIFYIKRVGDETGSEQWAGRPAVIVSNEENNRESECVEVVYLTGNIKNPLPTHVKVIAKIPSTALCEQITTVSKKRLGEYVKSCTAKEMREINKALAISLGLDAPIENVAEEPVTSSETGQDGQNRTAADETKSFLFNGEKAEIELKNEDQIRTEVERDLYKKLYEDTLERLIG